ncbi:MAG: alpha/beta hydrolase [Bacteriovoracaceae bacterium]|nr:alpha/beta hydrolase [Bacteriovoracaceae bacterium]
MKKTNSCVLITILLCFTSVTLKAEANYLDAFSPKNQELIKAHMSDNYYRGKNKTKNYYSKFSFSSDNISHPLVIITGLEDPAPFWYETALKAKESGFKEVYIVDLRGQGQSERVWPGEKKLIYVESFDDYVVDVVLFFNHALTDGVRPFIISHSTGSVVITQALSQLRPEHKPLKMSFWTPLFRLKVNPILENRIIGFLLRFFDRLARAINYPIVVKRYKSMDFNHNKLTSSPEKHKNSEFMRFEAGLGSYGVTLRWVLEAIEATKSFRTFLGYSLQTETLILKAEKEEVVDDRYQTTNKSLKVVSIPGAKHALNMETDQILNLANDLTFKYFSNDLK